jgi:signal transduction histidine kinase
MAQYVERTRDAQLAKLAIALHLQPLLPTAVLAAALERMAESVGAAQGAAAHLDDHNDPRYTALLGYFVDGGDVTFWRAMSQGILGFVMHGRRVVIVRNISTDPRWSGMPGLSLASGGSAIGIPLIAPESDALLGAVILTHPQIDYFSSGTARMLEIMGEITGAALAHALESDMLRASEAQARAEAGDAQAQRDQMARDEVLRRDLSAMIYHDLRNPLQNIQTSLSGLARVLAHTEKTVAHDLIDLASRSSLQINRMIKGLLDLERLEGGKAVIQRKPANILDLLNDAVDLVRALIQDSEQTVEIEVDSELPRPLIDADMIQRVVVNLVENAAKHTPGGGHITVSAHMTEHGLRIAIHDTGTGIPPGLRDRIFDKFFRVRHQNAPVGFGLGLAFCRLAVEAHGGRIWVESEVDHGSTFAFVLPVDVKDTAAQPKRAAAQAR